MALARPRIVVLDSATLGNVARDYCGSDKDLRDKARSFRSRLLDLGVSVAFTLTHMFELLGHADERVVRDRVQFLSSIRLIAWLRPYNRTWFPGSILDLLLRELHAVLHGSARDWREIVDTVRPELWETGVGGEMFVDNEELWSVMRTESQRQHELQQYVASVARTDPGCMSDVRLSETLRLPIRPKEERHAFMRRFASEMQRQLERHGDKRMEGAHEAARDFANNTLRNIEENEEIGGDPIARLRELGGVPIQCMTPEMTIGELGQLRVYAKQLRIIAEGLIPPANVTIVDVPPDTLPSEVLKRELFSIQMKADRVSGSDLGDGYIAPLVLYADAVEVDKRTNEFLRQVCRNVPRLASLMGRFFPVSDYGQILRRLDE